ncbi:hypothetical protein BJV74DRAFT_951787 [Russula compacta]|nr:hypothetical protein BJV74DRAFT_951787 [Russula compacta]
MHPSAIQIAAYAVLVGLTISPVALAAPIGDGDFHAREARLVLVPPTRPIHDDIPTDQPVVSERDIANAGDEIIFERTLDMSMHSHPGRHSSDHGGDNGGRPQDQQAGPPPGPVGDPFDVDFYRRALDSLD